MYTFSRTFSTFSRSLASISTILYTVSTTFYTFSKILSSISRHKYLFSKTLYTFCRVLYTFSSYKLKIRQLKTLDNEAKQQKERRKPDMTIKNPPSYYLKL